MIPKNKIMKKKSLKKTLFKFSAAIFAVFGIFLELDSPSSSFHLMLGSEQDFPNNFQSKVTPRRWYGNFKASGVMDYCPNHLWRHKAPNNETNSVKPSGRPIFGRRCFMYQQSDLKIWKKYNSSKKVTLKFSWNHFHGKFREIDFTTK